MVEPTTFAVRGLDHDKSAADAEVCRLGDATARYILAAQEHFEGLRQVATQIAGLMVLAEACGRPRFLDHPMLSKARDLFEECVHGISSLHPPGRAAHHNFHLLRAAAHLAETLERVDHALLQQSHRTDPLVTLKAAWGEIAHAANALPGFETVNFSQSCCAQHMKFRHAAAFVCEGDRS